MLGFTQRSKSFGFEERRSDSRLFESMDLHRRGQPPGDAQKKLDTAFFHAAVEKYGKPPGR